MSKSYNNAFQMTQTPDEISKTLRAMPTDPARVRRTDPGEPAKCPVYSFHKLYSTDEDRKWVEDGCRSAGIGCGDCKKKLGENINQKMEVPLKIKTDLLANSDKLDGLIADGCARARKVAKLQLEQVKDWTGFKPLGDWL